MYTVHPKVDPGCRMWKDSELSEMPRVLITNMKSRALSLSILSRYHFNPLCVQSQESRQGEATQVVDVAAVLLGGHGTASAALITMTCSKAHTQG